MLAEQGLVGLVALLFALGSLLWAGFTVNDPLPSQVRLWLTLGIVAAMGTWLTGHPLLVPEFSYVFWLFCGILAGTTPEPPQSRTPVVALACALLVLTTVPFRASAVRDKAALEHLAIGMSAWQHDDSQRYREGGSRFILFLPATGQPVKLPLRRAPGSPDPATVEFSVRGRVFDDVTLAGDDWHDAILTLPTRHRDFEQVEVTVHTAPVRTVSATMLVRVGRNGPP